MNVRDALADMIALATDAIEITGDDQQRIDAAREALADYDALARSMED